MRRRTIRAWLVAHSWSSVACTLFLLFLCLTGLPLIFHAEIDAWAAPPASLAPVPAGTRAPSLDALVARAAAARAGDVPLYMSFDEDRPVANVTTGPRADASATRMRFVSLDRRTGAVLLPHGSGVMGVVLRLHTDLMLGLGAELALGAMGMLFAIAIVSGVVLYAPYMAHLDFGTVRRGRRPRVARLDRHNLFGIVTLAWGLVVGLTGTINTLAVPLTAHWQRQELAAIGHGAAPATGTRSSVDRALALAMGAAPGMRPQFIAFPGAAYSSARHYGVYLQGATPLTRRLLTPVFVDAATGRLDAVGHMPWYMAALLLAQPLHFGDYGGWPMKLLWAALDLLTIAVLWGGLRLWLARRARPSRLRTDDLLRGAPHPARADPA